MNLKNSEQLIPDSVKPISEQFENDLKKTREGLKLSDDFYDAVFNPRNLPEMGKINDEIENLSPKYFSELQNITWGQLTERLVGFYGGKPEEAFIASSLSEARSGFERLVDSPFYHPTEEKKPFDESMVLSHYFFLSSKGRAQELYLIGSFLKQAPVSAEDTVSDLKEQLKNKKILILGDDTGSLSETLNLFGAIAVGIEYDKFKVLLARAGVFSEHGPQNQVILGDLGDLTDEQSGLYKKIQDLGPFDVIFSEAVFNGGSGVEDSIHNRFEDRYKDDRLFGSVSQFAAALTENCMKILTPKGFCLHTVVDMKDHSVGRGMFGDYQKPKKPRSYEHNHLVYIPKEGFKGLTHYKKSLV